MITKSLNEKKIITVKDVGGCTNFGGLDLNGSKMYTIKTKQGDRLSYISVYGNYKKTSRKNHKYADCMGHANDLCYANGNLYVAPCDKYVEVVSTGNWKHHRLYCDATITAIAHIAGNQFLGGGGGNPYKLYLLEPSGDKMVIKKRWNLANPKSAAGYTITQGIGYNKANGKLYVILTKNTYKANVILRAGLYETQPDTCYTSKTGTAKYEFECIGFTATGKAVIGTNKSKDGTYTAL